MKYCIDIYVSFSAGPQEATPSQRHDMELQDGLDHAHVLGDKNVHQHEAEVVQNLHPLFGNPPFLVVHPYQQQELHGDESPHRLPFEDAIIHIQVDQHDVDY